MRTKDRLDATGASKGGLGSWARAAHRPDRLAAIAPICGGREPAWAARLAYLPIWVFHGAKDRTVPREYSQVIVEAPQRAGTEARFTADLEAKHDSWTETYNHRKLYTRLLRQRRRVREAE